MDDINRTVAESLKMGMTLWRKCRGDKSRFLAAATVEMQARGRGSYISGQFVPDLGLIKELRCNYEWVNHGARTIAISDKVFASWAITKIERTDLADIELLAPAFALKISPGAGVTMVGEEVPFSLFFITEIISEDGPYTIMALANKNRCIFDTKLSSMIDYLFTGKSTHKLSETDKSIAKAIEYFDNRPHNENSEESTSAKRCLLAARRAIICALVELQYGRRGWGDRLCTSGISKGTLRDSPPLHREIVLGKDLRVTFDARKHVQAWTSMESGMPLSWQHIVRGHYKRQVVGPSNGGRKIIWVQPYWRGPEEAPILAKAYAIGNKEMTK